MVKTKDIYRSWQTELDGGDCTMPEGHLPFYANSIDKRDGAWYAAQRAKGVQFYSKFHNLEINSTWIILKQNGQMVTMDNIGRTSIITKEKQFKELTRLEKVSQKLAYIWRNTKSFSQFMNPYRAFVKSVGLSKSFNYYRKSV
jgi:hypothetical protein